ncbi:MAG: polyamine aminopropyltransferase [Chloroflexi bacterium]|nr:polyamine aminopropyltransferase [Chloroflexota bacterium]
MTEAKHNWFHDPITPDFTQLHSLKGIVYAIRTRYQEAEVIETGSFGRCLILDGKLQSSEADEFIYHEALVHPALACHPRPEKVFVAGGGEGATIREVLAHRSVRRAIMVDIDGEVVDLCRRLLPNHHRGAFDDPRLELRLEDARGYLEQTKERFHAIILDLPEPVEAGPAYKLFTREFYALVRERLELGGIVVVQSGGASYGRIECFTAIASTLRSIFPQVYPYAAEVPSFGGLWGFTLASLGPDPLSLSPQEVDARLEARLSHPLRFYDGLAHRGMFHLPKCHRERLAQEKTVIADDRPFYIY